VSFNDLLSGLLYDKRRVLKKLRFLYFLNNTGFVVKGKLFCGAAVAKSTFM
jgi:hypothetical protein